MFAFGFVDLVVLGGALRVGKQTRAQANSDTFALAGAQKFCAEDKAIDGLLCLIWD